MDKEIVKTAIDRLQRITEVSHNTAYDLVYSEIDIKSTEIVLEYIKQLEEDNKRLREDYVLLQNASDEYEDKLEGLPNKISNKIKEISDKIQNDSKNMYGYEVIEYTAQVEDLQEILGD